VFLKYNLNASLRGTINRMKLQYTKYGSTNMLWTLIPFVPIFSILPGLFIAGFIGKQIKNCERGFEITNWIAILGSIIVIILCAFHFIKKEAEPGARNVRTQYNLFNFLLYILVNTSAFIIMTGSKACCEGDGQTVLGVIFSGPVASVSLPVVGFIFDVIHAKSIRNE